MASRKMMWTGVAIGVTLAVGVSALSSAQTRNNAPTATALATQGITKVGPNALKIGEEVTVMGTPARNGSPLAGLRSLTRADGTVLGNAGGN